MRPAFMANLGRSEGQRDVLARLDALFGSP